MQMNPNKIPNVVFIGAKETGKTTTIEKLWNKNSSAINVQENIEGRGNIIYNVSELPFISFSIEKEIKDWIDNRENRNALINADVIVFLLAIDNITFSRKAKFFKQLQDAKIIKEDSVYYIKDLNSTNGTRVNGELLATYRLMPLSVNDRITVGNIDLIFH